MSIPVTVGGLPYDVPQKGELGWADGSRSLPPLLVALAAATASTPSFMQQTAVASTPVTVTSGRTYMVASNSLAVTLQLPAPAVNAWFLVKDSGGNSETNPITISPVSTETIDGQSGGMQLLVNYGMWGFMCDGTNWFLFITS